MNIQENVSLREYSTMRLGGNARFFVTIKTKDELVEALNFAESKSLACIMIGEGSNIVWSDAGFDGLVLLNRITGFTQKNLDEETALFTLASGENWDETVERTVKAGYSGIEQLSLIPGTVGGTPVQNVGAYGREIKDVLQSVEAYDINKRKFVQIANKDCGFGYRTSRFKTTDKGRFFITSITLKLKKINPEPPFYDSLQQYFALHNINEHTPAVVREAVVAVRTKKLPDPDVVANNGSFFANPIISSEQFAELEIKFPNIVHWPLKQQRVKISAAWLIESAGFANYHDAQTGMATWDKQPLVLINERARSTNDLLAFKQKIIDAVHSKFGITLVQEPELI